MNTKLLIVALFVVASTFTFSQNRITCPDGNTCSPDPGNPSYGPLITARAQKQNARGSRSPLFPRFTRPSHSAVIPGSQSYSYAMPILNLPGRNGLDLVLNLYYNSRVWAVDASNPSTPSISFDADRDFPSYGFRLDFGYLEANAGFPFILTESDGTKHAFSGTGNSFDSTDGTFIHYDLPSQTITYASGNTVQYQVFPTESNLYRPIKIKDTNGNFIIISYAPGTGNDQHISTITDTLGRVITFNYNGSNQLSSITQTVAVSSVDPTGVHTYATFAWGSLYGGGYAWYNFSASAVVLAPAFTSALNVLTKCTYANQTAHRFTYGDWAIINKIENLSANQTTRSYINYDYPLANQGALSDAPVYVHETVSPDGLTTNLSTWTYGFTKSGTGAVTSTVITDPAPFSNTFTANLNADGTISSLVSKNGSNVTLSTTGYTWKAVGPSERPDIVTTINDAGQPSSVQYFYDSNGNVTDLYERDFSGTTVRHTITSYKPAPWTTQHILNLPGSVTVKNGSDVIIARTDFDYDTITISPTIGGLPTHDDSTGSTRGNLTAVTRYSDPVTPSGGIARTFTYDSLGNLRVAQMDCCNQKTFNFSSVTQYAYPDSMVRGSSPQFTSSFTYNFDNGALKTSTDENNQQTQYQYNDPMYRLTATLPPPSNGTSVQNNVAFDDTSASPAITSSSTANSATVVHTFDGLGHLLGEDLKNGSVISSVKTVYDPLWRKYEVSNPFAPGETPLYTILGYDGLSRTTSIAPPSAGSTTITYSGNTTTIQDPAGKQRKNYFDALGRLAQVDEPGESSPGHTSGPGTLTIVGPLRSQSGVGAHNAAQATGTVSIWSNDPSGGDTHIDDPNEGGCPPLPQTCPQLYDTGSVTVTVNGTQYTVSYNRFSSDAGITSSLAGLINGNSLVSASANGTTITITARTAGSAGNNITLSASSVTGDPGDFGGPSFGGNPSGAKLANGSDASAGATVYDQGTVNVSIVTGGGTFTASAPYSQTVNNTEAFVAQALVGTGTTGLNRPGSPVSAQASGAAVTISYLSVGYAGNGTVTASSTSTQTQWSFPGGSFNGSVSLINGADAYSSGLAHPFSSTYTYDVLDHLTGVSQASGLVSGVQTAGQPRSFLYDSLGRLTSSTTPESGTVTTYYTNSSGAACSGDPSLVCRTLDARGVTKNFAYDGINRISGVTYTNDPANTAAVTYQYDFGGQAAFALDRLTKIIEGANSQTFTYDNLGRIAAVSNVIDGVTYPLGYGYNPANQIASITYPSGRVVSQNYDVVGRMQSITSAGTTYLNVVNTATDYNAAGQLKAVTYGNGVQGAFTYNDHMQPSSLRYFKSGTSPDILNLGYDYTSASQANNNGQIQAVHYYTQPGTEDQTKSESFTYDSIGRLKAAQTLVVNSTAGTWSLQWTYDRLGNRLSQTLVGGNVSIGQPNLTVDPATNRIVNNGFSYDSAGNMTHDATASYAYDGAKRLTSINGTAAIYTYFGPQRIKKVNGATTTRYIYSGDKVIAEYVNGAGANSPSTEYIYAASQLLATLAGSTTKYHHPDHLSNRAETDSAGAISRTFGQFPFGESWYETGTADKWKFAGYERDSASGETNLDYANFRYYSSGVGKFMSADLLGGHIASPQTLNRYSYPNDPINLADPMGLFCEVVSTTVTITDYDLDGNEKGSSTSTYEELLCTDDEPILGTGGSGGGDQDGVLPPGFRDRSRILLSNTDCANFLNNLLKNLGEMQDLNEFMRNFDLLAIVHTPNPASDSYLKAHPGRAPTAHVDAIDPQATSRSKANTTVHVDQPNAADLSQTLLHEELHTFPYSFSDQQLAKAAGAGSFPDTTAGADDASRAFSEEMSKHCHD